MACQTQITSRAAKATKTVKGAAKAKKSPKRATFYKNKLLEMSLFMYTTFLVLKIVIFIQN